MVNTKLGETNMEIDKRDNINKDEEEQKKKRGGGGCSGGSSSS